MLRCARAIVVRPNPDHARAFVKLKFEEPPCLAADAVSLLTDTLSKGVTLLLAREGWRHERFLRADQPRTGRLWQRTPPGELGLFFSAQSLALLCWLTAADVETPVPAMEEPVTEGDALFGFLTYRLFRETDLGKPLRKRLRGSVLCRLFFPADFTAPAPTDWLHWTTGVRGAIIESLERSLALRWIEIETGKRSIAEPNHILTVASGQDATLSGWLGACEQAKRWDLARFLLRAGSKLLTEGAIAAHWTGALKVKGLALAERTNLFRAALVFLKHWRRLAEWTGQARAIGYFDEGYAAAQLWKADWENVRGDDLTRTADNILREIEPLKPGSAP